MQQLPRRLRQFGKPPCHGNRRIHPNEGQLLLRSFKIDESATNHRTRRELARQRARLVNAHVR